MQLMGIRNKKHNSFYGWMIIIRSFKFCLFDRLGKTQSPPYHQQQAKETISV